jgi:serine/threonine protein kinase
MNEKTVLSGLECQFLINISHTFQDENNLYLVMDYLRGADLRYHICYKEKFTELETSTFFL